MKERAKHIHTLSDGRGPREVFLNGRRIRRVIYADEKKGFALVGYAVPRLDKNRENILTRTLRGKIEVREYQ